MNTKQRRPTTQLLARHGAKASTLSIALALCSAEVMAFQFDTGVEGLKTSWDNTIKYSNAWRLNERADNVMASSPNPNKDDGDRNFSTGLISNRFDLLSELDIKYGDVGARLSGAAWYDTVYNEKNDNNSPATANPVSVDYNEFTDKTRDLHGRDAEILDAFV